MPGCEPVSVVVSIADQRAYVYRGQTLIAVSSVSTGKDDKPTPDGTYPILQKKVDHKSNLYDAAPMPFMQRLTWDGIALHAGRNPGYAASHGCVRLPTAFAKKLFAITSVGSTVTIQDEPFVPGDDWTPPTPEPDADTSTRERPGAGVAGEVSPLYLPGTGRPKWPSPAVTPRVPRRWPSLFTTCPSPCGPIHAAR